MLASQMLRGSSFLALLVLVANASCALSLLAFSPITRSSVGTRAQDSTALAAAADAPFAIVVEAEIVPERTQEFLDVMEKDAVGSRKEPGCIRFDVIRSMDNENKYFFYEVYKDAAAVAFHKEQPHFALWTAFKESGGVVKSTSHKADGLFMTP